MNVLSSEKLAEIMRVFRESNELTKKELGNLMGMDEILIDCIESENFVPSIQQFETLSKTLNFDYHDLIVENGRMNSFSCLQNEALCDNEKEGIEQFFRMMLALRQQIKLRGSFENEKIIHDVC